MNAPPGDHPPDHVLDAFALGKLDEAAAEAIGRHLESCPSCCRRVAEVTSDTFLDQFRGARALTDSPTATGAPLAQAPSLHNGPAPPSSSPVGTLTRVRKYEVLRCLGDGGQGSAYLARDPGLGRLVVLKRYHHAGAADVEPEGQALARVRSRYTAQVYQLERQGDELFLVMEYLPGESLSEARKRRQLAPAEAARLIEQVAEGLEAVHACGLVHRDVKPSNIVLGEDSVPRLVDFGLAAHLGSPALRAISGSPPYMAPEQARGQWERIDARADIYGLGAVLYYLLTGHPPRDGKTPIEILERARDEPVVPPRRKNPRIPRGLERICLKAMAVDPWSRYSSAGALRHALRHHRLMWRTAPVLIAAVVLALLATAWAFRTGSVGPSASGQSGAIAVPGTAGPLSGSRPSPGAGLRVTAFEISYFRKLTEELYDQKRSGLLGIQTFAARLRDDVSVRARLSEPAYSYLIAFRPDGTDELCDPEDEAMPPPRQQEPMYPPPTKPAKRYRLSEGAGLYAFALVVSHRPLPSYREWKPLQGRMAWSAGLPCEPGVVWRDDGDGPRAFIAGNPAGTRGKDADARGFEGPVVALASWLRGRPGVDLATVQAFSVEPAPAP
jgi:predicted Ser/Thr protein kinase